MAGMISIAMIAERRPLPSEMAGMISIAITAERRPVAGEMAGMISIAMMAERVLTRCVLGPREPAEEPLVSWLCLRRMC